jgi:flagellar biogenesis protein FliO
MAGDAVIATLLLATMCLVMWWLARVAKRRMGIGAGTVAGNGLRVVGKRPLDQKNSLYVVEIAGGRHILVGTSMDGGGVSKVDDISPEEFAAMTTDEEPAQRRPRLRLAGGGASTDAASAPAADGDGGAVEVGDEAAPDQQEQRFATVGESFQMLLGKARDARDTRRNRPASGE